MAARLLALIAAVAMVVGSLAVRARIDEDGGNSGAGDTAGGELRLVCSTELASVCDGLKERANVSVEPAGITADRLSKDDPAGPVSLDGWLVPSPWPEIVRAARQRSGLAPLLDTGPVLARSPLVLAVWPTKTSVVGAGCPGRQVTWRCWGDAAVQRRVRPGHADVNEAVGAATVGAATVAFFQNRTDLARGDLEDNDEYRSWLGGLERSVATFRPLGSALQDMLLKGPLDFDAVATIEAEAGPLVSTSARPDKPAVIYPSPVTTVDVVLATVPSRRAKRLSGAVDGDTGLSALASSGWRVPKRPLARGVLPQPELPPADGLPAPGLLDFLRTLSKEVTR